MHPLLNDARFWSKVSSGSDPLDCWTWSAGVTAGGYGKFKWKGRHFPPHRVAYEMLVAEIPEGLVIDHLCRNRACVNPWHLEPVTQKVNVQRGLAGTLCVTRGDRTRSTHCQRGHELSGANLRVRTRGRYRMHVCRTCKRDRERERYHAAKLQKD